MPRRDYQDQLDALRQDICDLGDDVADRLAVTLACYEREDTTAASAVRDGDGEINQRYLDLESDCIDLVALQQPVAGDLRLVTASFKILTDIERVGDIATNLAAYAEDAPFGYAELNLVDLGLVAHEMFERAVTAYANGDVEACREIAARDEELDAMCTEVTDRVIRGLATASGRADIERAAEDVESVLMTVRDVERVGDHAVNVAARTLYMVENDDELLF
ncbi:phosphate signaling complex protein PhoU [Halobium salinum]|uniref:Phosphate-specific transport system accessory protein PhoU n=1 Tax=Halobium salinum TaxID=1364940 RepID=A0ABD5P8Y4_9EURY|nr:phosphate signaling complex protein PhoU [Halobium salinum]